MKQDEADEKERRDEKKVKHSSEPNNHRCAVGCLGGAAWSMRLRTPPAAPARGTRGRAGHARPPPPPPQASAAVALAHALDLALSERTGARQEKRRTENAGEQKNQDATQEALG